MINTKETAEILNKDNIRIISFYNGTQVWYAGDVISVTCIVDVTYFPFDSHTCELIMFTWVASSSVDLFSASDTADTTGYMVRLERQNVYSLFSGPSACNQRVVEI